VSPSRAGTEGPSSVRRRLHGRLSGPGEGSRKVQPSWIVTRHFRGGENGYSSPSVVFGLERAP
jgi:hypothetical protein